MVVTAEQLGREFFEAKMGARPSPDFRSTLFVADKHSGEIMSMDHVGVAIGYDGFVGRVCQLHIVVQEKSALTAGVLRSIFQRPFLDWGRTAVVAPVSSANFKSLRLCRGLGFAEFGALKDGAVDGDLILFRMYREGCKWLGKRNELH